MSTETEFELILNCKYTYDDGTETGGKCGTRKVSLTQVFNAFNLNDEKEAALLIRSLKEAMESFS